MLNQIQEIIEQITKKEVHQNNDISDSVASDVTKEAGNSITDGLKNAISNGDFSSITSLIKGENSSSNNVVQDIIGKFSNNLTEKVGVDSSTSSNLANNIIPQVLGGLFGSNSSLNPKDILSSFTGGDSKSGSFLDKLGGLGLDQNGDGKVDMNDAISAVKDGKLGDMLGGFFGKKK